MFTDFYRFVGLSCRCITRCVYSPVRGSFLLVCEFFGQEDVLGQDDLLAVIGGLDLGSRHAAGRSEGACDLGSRRGTIGGPASGQPAHVARPQEPVTVADRRLAPRGLVRTGTAAVADHSRGQSEPGAPELPKHQVH